MLAVANLSDYKRGDKPEILVAGPKCHVNWKKKAHKAIVLEVKLGSNASKAEKTLNQKVQDESIKTAYIKISERFAIDGTQAIIATPESSAVDGSEHDQSILQNRDEENINYMFQGEAVEKAGDHGITQVLVKASRSIYTCII